MIARGPVPSVSLYEALGSEAARRNDRHQPRSPRMIESDYRLMRAEAVARLRAYWRAEPNGEPRYGHPAPLWGVCPCCRGPEPSLGIGTWPDGSQRLSCWSCDALEEQVYAALGLEVPVDHWSREGMIRRLDAAIEDLERQMRVARVQRHRVVRRVF